MAYMHQGNSIPRTQKSWFKGHEAGVCLECSKNNKDMAVVGTEGVSCGCRNKLPQTGGLKQQQLILSEF